MMIRPVLVYSNKTLPVSMLWFVIGHGPAQSRALHAVPRSVAPAGIAGVSVHAGFGPYPNKNRPFTKSKRPVGKTGCGGRI